MITKDCFEHLGEGTIGNLPFLNVPKHVFY